MNLDHIYKKALNLDPLTLQEGLSIYVNAPSDELVFVANELRQVHAPGNYAGWIIDRNVNITNICFSQCSFCNFCRKRDSEDAYVTTMEEYSYKIDELFSHGGDQLLLQGGMNPQLGLEWYENLFRMLKSAYPALKLHALGPPEVAFLAKKEKLDFRTVLERLREAGLDSLPGAGAEILSDRVRKMVSPGKATVAEWLGVMREAHRMNLPTSATMMYGHAETQEERIRHLILLRELQEERPKGNYGFIAFIPWPFSDKDTVLRAKGIQSSYTAPGYIRLIAVSRMVLNNIQNIQTSILTVGKETAMLSLHAGANDLGSVMMEENVVSAAGSGFRYNADELRNVILEAGFIPRRRNQKYEPV